MSASQASSLDAIQQFLNEQGNGQPALVNDGDPETAGMSFAELFSHYLAPEVAKLPTAPEPFTFGTSASEFPTASTSTAAFDPSTFMPTLPGSPIGAFSPSSDGNSTGRSPMSLPDLDFSATSDPFSIDPSIFGAAPDFAAGTGVDTAFTTPASQHSPEQPAPLSLGNAPLPPLPSLPLLPLADQFFALPPPPAPEPVAAPAPAPVATTASGRPKRNVATMVIEEEDEDENAYSSDASAATAASSAPRKSTRAKKPAAKKARASSVSSASGGAATTAAGKKLSRTSVQPLASETLHKTTSRSSLPPVPQWADKPDAEEYAKLSSKEKRQLRNKLSARNFRHRRKEYITTLEEEISSRDTLITSLRDEVGVIRAENTGLKTEVETLKSKWSELLSKLESLTTPPASATTAAAGLGTNPARAVAAAGSSPVAVKQEDGWALDSASPVASTSQLPPPTGGAASARRIGTRSSSQIQLPNLSKDVAASGKRWSTGFGAGGFTSVHTTLVPDVGSQLAEGLAPKPPAAAYASQQSFNPALNALAASGQLADLSSFTSHLRSSPSAPPTAAGQKPSVPHGTFEDFFAANPYWLRPDQLDQHRAALYGKLANNAAGLAAAQKQQGSLSQQQLGEYLPVPAGFRPAFFRASSGGAGAKVAQNHELLAFQSPSTAAAAVSHQDALALRDASTAAAIATAAQKTLVQRMAGAFWEAFSGASSSSSSPLASSAVPNPQLDPKKVASVLSGQARVEVVPVSTPKVDELGAALGSLSLATGGRSPRSRSPTPLPAAQQQCAFDEVCRQWTKEGQNGAAREQA
ncbi:hypothetical protein JCM10213_002195 [Rhodosporidiobolus nylandii]